MDTDVFDFRRSKPNEVKLINEIAEKIKPEYIIFLTALGENYAKDIDWWMLNFVSRNTLVSPLFRNICYLIFLDKMISAGHNYKSIIVDSPALKEVLYKFRNKNKYSFKIIYYGKNMVRRFFYNFTTYTIVVIHILLRFIYSKKYKNQSKIEKGSTLKLIDIFIFQNSFEKGYYDDRYYPNLFDFIDSTKKRILYYVPTFYNINKYNKIFFDIRKSNQNFLIKEDYLKFQDYFFASLYVFRASKFDIKNKEFMGFCISPLLKEEICKDRVSNSSIYGLLNYRFAKRLKEKNIKLDVVINWFENQTIDHGFNAGFRKYYPEANLIGYLGIPLQNNYLSLYPTEQERINEVIPKDIFVIGKGYIELVKKFCKRLSVKVVPALRFSMVWNKRDCYPDNEVCTILVALPILIDESDEIISIILELVKLIKKDNCIFKIKPHPSHNMQKLIKRWGKEFIDMLEFTDEDFNTCVEKSDLLISSASSVCLETIAKGIPVIIIANKLGLTQLPIPEEIEQHIWKLCYSEKDIMKAVKLFISKDINEIQRYSDIGKEIREKYFEPLEKEKLKDFLKLL